MVLSESPEGDVILQASSLFAKCLQLNSIRNMYLNFACRHRSLQNKKSGGDHPVGLLYKRNRLSGSVGQYSLISAAAVLINNSLAGLVIDFVALAAGLGNILRRCFVTVA